MKQKLSFIYIVFITFAVTGVFYFYYYLLRCDNPQVLCFMIKHFV